jgi:hypothetical protein
VGGYELKIATLRDRKAEAVATLDKIERGGPIMQQGVDISERRRRRLQNVIVTLDAGGRRGRWLAWSKVSSRSARKFPSARSRGLRRLSVQFRRTC